MGRVIVLHGSIDAGRLRAERNQLEDLIDGERDVLIDFNEVSYLDPSGLGWLAYVRKRVGERGGRMTIANVRGQPRHVFSDMQLDALLETSDLPVEAVWPRRMLNRAVARRSLKALRQAPQLVRRLAQAGGVIAKPASSSPSSRRGQTA